MANRNITIMEFDFAYQNQGFYRDFEYEWIDMTKMESVNRFCTQTSFAMIKNRLQSNRFRQITFLGSGNYHYVTLALLQMIKEPFTLVLVDHHSDLMMPLTDELVSCGSWVANALDQISLMQKVMLIGPRGTEKKLFPTEYVNRIELVGSHFLGSDGRNVFRAINTKAVYISIDKDVLDPQEAETNWDQGRMHLDKIIRMLKVIFADHKIIGVDICGEAAIVDDFAESMKAIEKNDRANRRLLETLVRLQKESLHRG
ncbi:MAG: arginase family protein [Candidatus Izemoplasmatales bacterium]|jgi:arginase family enzyme|nr:arginase family protein [Candidatus Izemoplasmatales bacterium]MDD3865060.1 arginase family protein [Candidatus Izemoplasmatales bacterium]